MWSKRLVMDNNKADVYMQQVGRALTLGLILILYVFQITRALIISTGSNYLTHLADLHIIGLLGRLIML